MANPRSVSTRRAVLSYDHLKELTSFPDLMLKDYQGILADFVFTSDEIDDLEVKVTQNTDDIEAHVTSDSEHGVTGVNVGTEDFCTTLTGGVVLLSALVNDAINSNQSIILADIAAAPAAYDQVYTQTLASMANDTKAKHNQLVIDVNAAIAQINDIIAKAKTAKQMSV